MMTMLIPMAIIGLLALAGAAVFGGGALLFVGARFAAKIRGARYWKSVGVHVVSGLAGGVAGGIIVALGRTGGPEFAILMSMVGCGASLVITWLVIGAMFHTSFGKAVLAWLPTLGMLVVVLPVLALLVSIAMPGLGSARELARRASCKADVSYIAMALALYTANNRDVWPQDLGYLDPNGESPERFVCPSRANPPSPGKFDYFYLATDGNANGNTIVLCDYKRNHKDGYRSILYADLHVGEARNDADFQQQLAQPWNAAFAKALRAAEGP